VSPGAVFCPKVAAIVANSVSGTGAQPRPSILSELHGACPHILLDAFNCKGVDCAGAMSLALF
jgi:hypothetical protein